jgi:hypothetical protein
MTASMLSIVSLHLKYESLHRISRGSNNDSPSESIPPADHLVMTLAKTVPESSLDKARPYRLL